MATSKPTPQIKIIPLTKDSCCGYCFASPDEMKYPLALPCGHPQCKECIELDLAMNFDAQCKICRVTHKDFTVETLSELSKEEVDTAVAEIRAEENLPLPNPKCDICKTQPDDAMVWCKDCKKCICDKHLEGHSQTFTDNHKLIPIQDYEKAPLRYHVRNCEKHSEFPILEVCQNCEMPFCKRCTTRDNCLVRNGDHQIKAIEDITGGYRDEMYDLRERLYYKIKRCHQQEKRAWKSLSDLESHIDGVHQDIDRIKEQMIKRIENEAEDLKAKFSSHLDEQTADVNKFSDSVATEITVFTDLMMAAEFLVNKAHDMEVLRRYGGLKSQLEEKVVDERFESFFGIKRVYLRKENENIQLGLQMTPSPTNLELLASAETKTHCSAAIIEDDGTITTGVHGAIESRDKALRLSKTFEINGLVYGLGELFGEGNRYLRYLNDGKFHVSYLAKDKPLVNVLDPVSFEGDQEIPYGQKPLADKRVPLISSKTQKCVIFSLTEEGRVRYQHIDNTTVLFSEEKAGRLSKFVIDLSQSTKRCVWTLKDLNNPTGLTINGSGLILVACGSTKKYIAMVDMKGKKMDAVLTCPEFESIQFISKMNARDGLLVVACGEEGVKLFKYS